MASYKIFCPNHHVMDHTFQNRPYLYCSTCKAHLTQINEGYYQCRACNYDTCDKCFNKNKQMICTAGHPCKTYPAGTATDAHVCFKCHQVPSHNHVEYFVCEECKCYVCITCGIKIGMEMMQQAMGMFGNMMGNSENPGAMFGGMAQGFGGMMGAFKPN